MGIAVAIVLALGLMLVPSMTYAVDEPEPVEDFFDIGTDDDPAGIDAVGASGLRLGEPEGGALGAVVGVINIFIGLVGLIAVVLFLYAGFLWMTAAGNEEKVTKARSMMIAAVIGIVIIFLSFALSKFVISKISDISGAGGTTSGGGL